MEPKHSSATVLASALAVSCSAVYFLFTMANQRKDNSRTGKMASVRAVSNTEVMNISTRPKMATTMLRSATLMLEVPALFIRRVSCSTGPKLDMQKHLHTVSGGRYMVTDSSALLALYCVPCYQHVPQ